MSENPLFNGDTITVHVAAKHILGLTDEHVRRLCRMGVFKTARKPGYGKQAEWRLSRREVLEHLNRPILEE